MADTILLIDDNPLIMEINRNALTGYGYRVLEARSINQSRKVLKTETPDLIIMEAKLPDGCGLHYCREIRSMKDIPIMFVSVLNTTDDEAAGFDAGASEYVPKPYTTDTLVIRMEGLLRRVRRTSGQEFSTKRLKK
ncbi:MAG: response regulator [Defluviitaleaceae bacterium]|nr:response regulator [Defluviitaleaceae bacterium]